MEAEMEHNMETRFIVAGAKVSSCSSRVGHVPMQHFSLGLNPEILNGLRPQPWP